MKSIYLVMCLVFFAGCTSTEAVYKNYDRLVHAGSGVNAEQAKIIAQRLLIDTEEKDLYRLSYPDIKTGEIVYKYPDFWFVVFGHNFLEPMSSDRLTDTYRELLSTEYLVVINKTTGKILFSGQWYPKR